MCIFSDRMKFSFKAQTRIHGVRIWISAYKRVLMPQNDFPVISIISCIFKPVDSLMANVYMCAYSTRENSQSDKAEQKEEKWK